jgi:uncharacterized membrane protein
MDIKLKEENYNKVIKRATYNMIKQLQNITEKWQQFCEKTNKVYFHERIWGSHGGEYEDGCLVGCSAATQKTAIFVLSWKFISV